MLSGDVLFNGSVGRTDLRAATGRPSASRSGCFSTRFRRRPPSIPVTSKRAEPPDETRCVIIDDLRTDEREGMLEHSARVRWQDGAHGLRFSVQAELSSPGEDGSPYLAACLLQAMRRGEDLEVDAPASPRGCEWGGRNRVRTSKGRPEERPLAPHEGPRPHGGGHNPYRISRRCCSR